MLGTLCFEKVASYLIEVFSSCKSWGGGNLLFSFQIQMDKVTQVLTESDQYKHLMTMFCLCRTG